MPAGPFVRAVYWPAYLAVFAVVWYLMYRYLLFRSRTRLENKWAEFREHVEAHIEEDNFEHSWIADAKERLEALEAGNLVDAK